MPKVKFERGFSPFQLEHFPDGSARSHAGAIYICPNSVADLTDDELKHLYRSHPLMSRFVSVYKESRKPKPALAAAKEKIVKEAPKAQESKPKEVQKKEEPEKKG